MNEVNKGWICILTKGESIVKRQKQKFRGLIACALLVSVACVGCQSKEPSSVGFRKMGDESIMFEQSQWGELNTHDPAIIKDGDSYYVFSTDASYGDVHKRGVQIRKSKDLITWEYVGTAFKDFERDCEEAIEWAKLDPQKDGLWAPDIIKVGNKYRLYYSASTFGSTRSCIGLAESKKIEGPYEHKGIVYKSEANAVNNPNAIDPAFIKDKEGKMYMAYGSFFGGIFLGLLDEETGMLDDSFEPIRIAGSRGAAVEGSYIEYVQETDYYYLFVSYGSLSSDYNIRVGRSREVTGPYIDAQGNRMDTLGVGNEDQIGTKLMGGYFFASDPGSVQTKGYMAPGHNSILNDNGTYYIAHHTRTYELPNYWFGMNIRGITFNRFKWPVVYPNRYFGEKLEKVESIDGEYGLIQHLSDNNKEAHRSIPVIFKDNQITGDVTGEYKLYDEYRIEITIEGVVYDGVVIKQYDWEREQEVMAFTAMSEKGQAIWGCTQL